MLRARLSSRLARTLALALGLALLGAGPGCVVPPQPRPTARKEAPPPPKDYGRELPAGAHALRKITDPADLPDLTGALRDREAFRAGVASSLRYLRKASSKRFFPMSGISHEQVKASLEVLGALLDSEKSDDEVLAALRSTFDVYTTVGFDDRGGVLFTGYYTPIFKASLTRTERFQHPIHRLPSWHVKDPITGETKGRRRKDGSIDPTYPARGELVSSGALDGLELAWFEHAWEPYVLGVQGSGILDLEDGTRLEVGYAGTNGRPYASVGAELIKRGILKKEELSLCRLIEYFWAHPEQLAPLTATNERYVFFQEARGGPWGCLNEPVQALVSIATDKAIFPRGAPCLLVADLPAGPGGQQTSWRGLVLDHDAGGAIRAPGRCDVYMGVGEEAGLRAGRTFSEGRLYYLVLRDGAWGAGSLPASAPREE